MISGRLGHYHILEKLGAGGMAVVYRARDERLDRDVALKILPEGALAGEAARRNFQTEARLLSRLNHPNIEAIYDFDTQAGIDFLVMEFVEGRTLRAHLREGLDRDTVLRVTEQCGEALEAAHRKGVVHLDIKPENIMLTTDGRAKLLDFGVARRLRLATEDVASITTRTTEAEIAAGTPGYIAPEILLNRPVDGRADIFSLGVVCYEGLAGRHPFLGASIGETVARVLHEVPPPLRAVNADIPAEVERVVHRMLAKEPAMRHPGAGDLVADLHVARGLPAEAAGARRAPAGPAAGRHRAAVLATALAAGLMLAAAGVILWINPDLLRPAAGPASRPRRLAVLRFDATDDEARTRAFSDGLTEVLTVRLTRIADRRALHVAPASEVRRVDDASVQKAGLELGVDLLLTGQLQRFGDSVRTSVNLVDVRERRQLQAETVEGTLREPFVLEDRIVEAAVRMLEVGPPPSDGESPRLRGPAVADAYDYYLQGRGYLRSYDRPQSVDSAVTVFQRSLLIDPGYAPAHAGLGMACWYKFDLTREPAWLEKSRASCREAIRLDARAPEGRLCLGMVFEGTGRYAEAAAEFEKVAALDPGDEEALLWQARAYERLGRTDNAEATYRQAIALRPSSWVGYNWLGTFYFDLARYAEAQDMFRQVVALAPDSHRGFHNLGATYLMQGLFKEAIPILERSIELEPAPTGFMNLGAAHFMLGHYDRAAEIYREAIRSGHAEYTIWGNLGEALYWAPGKRSEAAPAFRQAVELARRELEVNPKDIAVAAELAKYHAALGKEAESLALVRRVLESGKAGAEERLAVATTYAQLGHTVEALHWLGEAVRAGYPAASLGNLPVFQSLRNKPEFVALLGTPGARR